MWKDKMRCIGKEKIMKDKEGKKRIKQKKTAKAGNLQSCAKYLCPIKILINQRSAAIH